LRGLFDIGGPITATEGSAWLPEQARHPAERVTGRVLRLA
jgi:hypothetical protein